MSFAPPDPADRHTLADTTVDQAVDHPADRAAWHRRAIRAGDLTTIWRLALGLAWLLAFFSYAAVWQVSFQIGIGTWWLGPRADPQPDVVRLLPFVVPILIELVLIWEVRRPAVISLFGAGLAAVIAIPDFSRATSLGLLELTIAACLAVVSLAAFTGTYRPGS